MNNDVAEIINVYHELVMQDISVMRGNYPALHSEMFSTSQTGYLYYINSFPLFSNRSERALDLMILSYGILMGISKKECGINPQNPKRISSPEDCGEKIINELARLTGLLSQEQSQRFEEDYCKRIASYFTNVLKTLVDKGLIHILPDNVVPKEDNVNPYAYLGKINGGTALIRLGSINEIVSLRVAAKLEKELEKLLPSGCKVDRFLSLIDCELRRLLGEKEQLWFKTAHGELFRLASNAGALPNNIANYETFILPFILEPTIPPQGVEGQSIGIDELKPLLRKFFNNGNTPTGSLGETYEILIEALLYALKENGFRTLTNYQYEYLKNLLNEGNKLTLITSPTGSGKTLIFNIYTIARILKSKLENRANTAIYLYPRKSLARDQLEKLINLLYVFNKRLEENGKRHYKINIGIRDLNSLARRKRNIEVSVKQNLREILINSKQRLCHKLDNEGYKAYISNDGDCECLEECEELDWIYDVKEKSYSRHLSIIDLLITNDSMLSKITYEAFVKKSVSVKWQALFSNLGTIVIDEAHTYLEPEKMSLLYVTLMKLLYLKGTRRNAKDIQQLMERNGLDIIFSSATISNSDLMRVIDKQTGHSYNIDPRNILGIMAFPNCSKRLEMNSPPEELESFVRGILGNRLYSFFKQKNSIVYNDYLYATFCKNSNDTNGLRYSWKLRITGITFPVPDKNSWTSLAETFVTVLHWLISMRRRSGLSSLSSVFFIDNKATIREVVNKITERFILEAKDHADRLLLTVLYPSEKRAEAFKQIVTVQLRSNARDMFDLVWDRWSYGNKYFSRYQNISLYLNPLELKNIRDIPNSEEKLRQFFIQHLPSIKNIIDDINEYAEKFRTLRENIVDASNNENMTYYYLYHHADIDKETRSNIEKVISRGEALATFSTSTLEVGVDIRGLALVIQYGTTANTAELQQRMGRAGRGPESLNVSTGLIVLRNTGQDISLLDEENAVSYVFNLTIPFYGIPEDDVVTLSRLLAPLVLVGEREPDKTIEQLLRFYSLPDMIIGKVLRTLRLTHAIYMEFVEQAPIDSNEGLEETLQLLTYYYEEIDMHYKKLLQRDNKKLTDVVKHIRSTLEELLKYSKEAENDPIYLYLLAKTTSYMIDFLRKDTVSAIDEPRISGTISRLERVLETLEKHLVNLVIDNKLKLLWDGEDLGKIRTSELRSFTPPGIPSEIGTIEKKYLIFELTSAGINQEKQVSFTELVMNTLPLKTIGK